MLTFSDVYDMKDLNRTKQKLIIQRYSTNTISTYISCLEQFDRFIKKEELPINESVIYIYRIVSILKNHS